MSSYANFYIRSKNGDWCPIGSFCRSSQLYQSIEPYLSYEEGKALTHNTIKLILNDINDEKDRYNVFITEYLNSKESIYKMNNSIEEKMEELESINTFITECKDTITDLDAARQYLLFLDGILHEADDTRFYEEENLHIVTENYIYAGIEWDPRLS